MADKIRIAVLGVGGVGGYIGGLLAAKYFGSENVEVIFIVKSNTEQIIKDKGLKLITPENEKMIFPDLVSSDPSLVGPVDYLLCAVKGYDLEDSLLHIKDCLTPQTVILPLLNGVDAPERISKIYSWTEVWKGCVYIVARLIEPGVVKETGNIRVLYFGSETATEKKLKDFEKILTDAGIDARLSDNIEKTIWEKFIFISPFATLTTFLDLQIADVLNNPGHKSILISLLTELKAIADAKQIPFPENIIDETIAKMEKIAPGSFSSMHSDFRKGGMTEIKSLTEYVIMQGRIHSIPTPTYNKIYNGILGKLLRIKDK